MRDEKVGSSGDAMARRIPLPLTFPEQEEWRKDEKRDAGHSDCLHVSSKGGPPLAPSWSFASLLHPVSTGGFCRDFWGRRPLHIARAASDFYRDLIDLPELESYLALDELFQRESVSTPSRQYGVPEGPPTCISQVYQRLLNGDSLRLRRMERFVRPDAPTISLIRNMEQVLQHPRDSISCYVAPPNARGLGPHHDETEIFTLQISGTKRWKLFHRVNTDQAGIHEPDHLGEPTDDFVLQPGDLFYLPRGVVHDVVTTGLPSFSLTLVFAPFQWSTMLDLLVSRLAATGAFLEALPAGAFSDETRPETFRWDFEKRLGLIRDALSGLTSDALLDELRIRQLKSTTMPPEAHLEHLFALDTVSLETWLEKRPGVTCHLTYKNDRVLLIMPGGNVVEASPRAASAFQQIVEEDQPFHVSEMHESLSAGAKVALAKKLVACGLLRIVSQESECDLQ